jgi:hypothetical protein
MKKADSSSDEEPIKFANSVFATSKEKPHSDRMVKVLSFIWGTQNAIFSLLCSLILFIWFAR